MNIDSSQISVIVQGAVAGEQTKKCLESVRQYLPQSEIILSTWQGSDVSGLEYDKLVLNNDPGSSGFRNFDKAPDNTNRQITSTFNGLKQATRKYAMKLRTDFCLSGTGFLNYFGEHNLYINKFKLFDSRILVLHPFTVYPFAVADFFMFGKTNDLLSFWNIPYVSPDEQVWMQHHQPITPKKYKTSQSELRFFPEMYFMIQNIKKVYPDVLKLCPDYTAENRKIMKLSEKYVINNFVWAGVKDGVDVIPLKPELSALKDYESFALFNGLYNKYCIKYSFFVKIKNYILSLFKKGVA